MSYDPQRRKQINQAALVVYMDLVDRFTRAVRATPMEPDRIEQLTTLIRLFEQEHPTVHAQAQQLLNAKPQPKDKQHGL